MTLLERSDGQGARSLVSSAGDEPSLSPEAADAAVALDDRLTLALRGRALPAEQQRVLAAFAAQAAQVLERERLREVAAEADRLAEGNRIRTALLAAVSHDLRTPLAGIKAAASSLLEPDLDLSPEDRSELLDVPEALAPVVADPGCSSG